MTDRTRGKREQAVQRASGKWQPPTVTVGESIDGWDGSLPGEGAEVRSFAEDAQQQALDHIRDLADYQESKNVKWLTIPLQVARDLLGVEKPYDPAHACPDCPIGGQDGSGPVCPNADACDRDCQSQVEAHRADEREHMSELDAARVERARRIYDAATDLDQALCWITWDPSSRKHRTIQNRRRELALLLYGPAEPADQQAYPCPNTGKECVEHCTRDPGGCMHGTPYPGDPPKPPTAGREHAVLVNRSANWRDTLDDDGCPTQGPLDFEGCQYCGGTLDATAAVGIYECPWCIARFPDGRGFDGELGLAIELTEKVAHSPARWLELQTLRSFRAMWELKDGNPPGYSQETARKWKARAAHLERAVRSILAEEQDEALATGAKKPEDEAHG